jgi:membrane protein DedA with SNARE-associated domain
MDEPQASQVPEVEVAERPPRLTDTQALIAIGAWIAFRQITARIGIGVAPRVARTKPWLIPLMTNAFPQVILAGTGIGGNRWLLFAVTAFASVLMSTVVGLIFYWAGWRFGHRLAELAKKPGSPWASIWNPKQIARAERWMDRWGIIVVFLGRATEHFTLPITLVAGASEMRLRRFLAAHIAGAIAFAVGFLWIGVEAQERWPGLRHWIEHTYAPWAFWIGIGSLGLLALAFVAGRFVPSQEDESTTTPSEGPSESPPENS